MVQPLAVDPARLKEAGAQLHALIFPQSPAPVAAPGSDAVSVILQDGYFPLGAVDIVADIRLSLPDQPGRDAVTAAAASPSQF
jgi:hypothetical protein